MGRLEGKRAIVTGAGSGIGRATSIRFAAEGAAVLAVDWNEQGAHATAEAIEKAGGRALAVRADVGKEDDVAAFAARCISELGGLGVLYANAGVSGGVSQILELTEKDWRDTLQVNLIGVFLCIKHAALHMVSHGGGSIICTASVAGLRAHAGGSAYSASKAGVISLVQTAANQLGRQDVRVNAICPGLIKTGMTKMMFDYAKQRGTTHKIGQLNPRHRGGVPDDIANMALFLASDESDYVNGQALAVDGGLSSTHPFVPGRLA